MAGSTVPGRSYWPQGPDGWFPIRLGPGTIIGDTSGFKTFAVSYIPADLNVKAAYLGMKEGSWAKGGATEIYVKVEDDTGTPQVVVAGTRAIDTNDDAGNEIELTVADEGPILAGSQLRFMMDASDASDTAVDVVITLWCKPVYY